MFVSTQLLTTVLYDYSISTIDPSPSQSHTWSLWSVPLLMLLFLNWVPPNKQSFIAVSNAWRCANCAEIDVERFFYDLKLNSSLLGILCCLYKCLCHKELTKRQQTQFEATDCCDSMLTESCIWVAIDTRSTCCTFPYMECLLYICFYDSKNP